ncbi:MAG: hypothetical protein JWM74_3240 [Myxococcaceae bacterium]|nr:hypothetical protein [Myxococcaceae bacterium]
MKRALVVSLLAIAIVAGCSKSTPDAPAAPSAAASVVAPASSGSSSGSGSGSEKAPAKSSWSGKYTSTPGTITVPDGGEWSYVKWRGDESKDGLGEGALVLEIERNVVTGTLDGPLGPATVSGIVDGTQVSARIERKTPSDNGFSGTLVGTLGTPAATLEGTMHLSVHDAHIIRVAKFSLAPAK